MKNVLMLGRGSKAGAWRIRGEQLGSAIGAKVANGLNNSNLIGFDLIVGVKRLLNEDVKRVHESGIPLVWDIVDAWPQPMGNWWARDVCMRWLTTEFRRLKPIGLVVNTQRMADDCAKLGVPVLVLPHHARPHVARAPLRPDIKRVGYEGGTGYLGHWEETLRNLCRRRGWTFEVNPETMSDMDIIVALRHHPGYAAKNWKSNIKLANAQGLGTPVVCNREQGYLETACGAECWADTNEELEDALFALENLNGARVTLSNKLYDAAPRIEPLAQRYKEWLEALQ